MSGGGGTLIRTMPDKGGGGGGSENPSFGRTSFVNGPLPDWPNDRIYPQTTSQGRLFKKVYSHHFYTTH
jgi:hypothetical protein